jgi:hypothetical protein
MKGLKVKTRTLVTAACAAIAVSLTAIASPVTAAAAPAGANGWRLVYSHHYGPPSNSSSYEAVAAAAKGDAWVFGGSNLGTALPSAGTPVAEHWNGSKWAAASLLAGLHGDITASSTVSPADVWAVAESRTTNAAVLHWNGTRWSIAGQLPGTAGDTVTGAVALSSTDGWVSVP